MTSFIDRRGIKARGVLYSNPHLIRLESRGAFPRRVTLSKTRVCWVESEVEDWLQARIAERDEANSGRSDGGQGA